MEDVAVMSAVEQARAAAAAAAEAEARAEESQRLAVEKLAAAEVGCHRNRKGRRPTTEPATPLTYHLTYYVRT